MFLLFLSYFLKNCSNEITIKTGVHKYSFDAIDGDVFCINSSYYPLSIIFNNFADDTIFDSYGSADNSIEQINDKESTLIRFLPIFKSFSDPFRFLQISTPTSTNLKFVIAALPGMCDTGFYISTKENDIIDFSEKSSNFFRINAYDDKCLIFACHNKNTIVAETKSENNEDQVFIYSSYTNYTSISGNDTMQIDTDDDGDELPFVRIVADDYFSSLAAKITFASEGGNTSIIQDYGYLIEKREGNACKETTLGKERTSIAMIVVVLVLIIADAIFIAMQCFKTDIQYQFDDSNDADMSSLVSSQNDIQTSYSKFSISHFSNKDLIIYPH